MKKDFLAIALSVASTGLAVVPHADARSKSGTRGPFVYDCVGESQSEITVLYLGATASRARLTYQRETVVASHSVSADGGLYTAPDIEFWGKGDDAVVEWRGEKLKCALRK